MNKSKNMQNCPALGLKIFNNILRNSPLVLITQEWHAVAYVIGYSPLAFG